MSLENTMDSQEYVFKPGFEQGTVVRVKMLENRKEEICGIFECWDEDRRGFWITQLLPGKAWKLGRRWIQSAANPHMEIVERPGTHGIQDYLWVFICFELESESRAYQKALSLITSQEMLVQLACMQRSTTMSEAIRDEALKLVIDAAVLKRGIDRLSIEDGELFVRLKTKLNTRLNELIPHSNGTAYRG